MGRRKELHLRKTLIGKTLGKYEIQDLLGRGGMGEVYRARDTELGRDVALKLLPDHLAADPERQKRLRREAQALASVHDPRIATLFSYEQAEGHHFLVMELVEGQDLAQRINQGPLPVEESVAIVREIAIGLAKAHDNGIVHRDLKPANIRFDADGNLKILDFGIAHLSEETQITQPGTTMGTPAYMSPEQVRGAAIDARSDIFSLGVLFYELTAGVRPFTGPTHAAILESITHTQPEPLEKKAPNVPSSVSHMVERSLQKLPDDRYQTLGELVADLHPIDPSVMASDPWRSDRPFSWKPILSVVTLIAVAAAIGLLAFQLWPSPQPANNAAGKVVVVLPFENLTGDASLEWLERGIPELLTASLAKAGGLEVVSSQRLAQLLQGDDSIDETRALEVARKAGATDLIDGSIFQTGNVLRIQSNLIETEQGSVQHAIQVDGHGESDVFSLVADMTSLTRGYFEVRVAEEQLDEKWIRGLMTDSVEALRDFARARQYSLQSDWANSARFHLRAVAADSNFVAAWVGLSAASWNLDDSETMERAYAQAQRLRDRTSGRERAYVDLMGAVIHNDPELIIVSASELSKLEPEEPYWRYLWGRGYYTDRQYAKAVSLWRPLAEDRWSWIWTYVYLSDCYRELSQLAEARTIMATAWDVADETPNLQRSPLYRFQARIKFAEGDYEGALADLQAAFGLQPGYPEAHYDWGVMLQERGDVGAAREHLETFVRTQKSGIYLEDAQDRLRALDTEPR